MASTIDDFVNSGNSLDYLAGLMDEIKTAYGFMKTAFNYGLLGGAGFLSYAASGAAGPVTAGAMMLGKVLLNFKKKAKTEWNKLYKEGWKGLVLGNLAKAFYQNIIASITNKTFYGKIGRALAYNPGFMGFVYNPVYLAMTKKQNKTSQKSEWWDLTKRVFKYNFVPHYFTTNYIGNVQQQVAASAFLGTAYRVIAG